MSVPVLSEQIIETLPSPSTACSLRMIACSFAIFCVPKESTIVTIELNASGIAATASATANINALLIFSPRNTFIANKSPQNIRIIIESFFPKTSKLTWSGVCFSEVDFKSPAIFPTSVCIPISVTIAFPRPYVTKLPENSIFARSPSGASVNIVSMFFSTARLSPVRALSSILRLAFSISLPSAGIISPASSSITSPTTSSLAGIWTIVPSRNTFASGPERFFKLCRDCSAFTVCIVPKIALIVITVTITAALSTSPSIPDMIADAIRINTRKSLYCSKKICRMPFFFPSVSSFHPRFSLDLFTCSLVSPDFFPFTLSRTSSTVC